MTLDPALATEVRELFEDLHRHPELSWREERTSARLQAFLEGRGVPVSRPEVEHALVVDVEGSAPGRRVLLRADLDALPVEEATDLDYRSTVPGVMHACGHDLHAALLAAAAVQLWGERDRLAGAVRCVFQPSEEAAPSGAQALVAAGVAEGCEAALALHADPSLPVGRIGVRDGAITAGVDGVGIVVKGKGGHAARPYLAVDPVRVGALLVTQLHHLVGRAIPPHESAILTVTTFQAGASPNIIPPEARLDGTLRTYSPQAREKIVAAIRRVCEGVTAAHGATCTLDLRTGQPPVRNDPALTGQVRTAAREVLGGTAVQEIDHPSLGGDDFAYFGAVAPQVLFRLGVRPEGEAPAADLHSPRFVADPAALPVGARLWTALARRVAAPGS